MGVGLLGLINSLPLEKKAPRYSCKKCKESTRTLYDGVCEYCNLGTVNPRNKKKIG